MLLLKMTTRWLGVLTVALGFALPAVAVEITISCGAVGKERQLCEQAVREWEQQTGHTVHVSSPPQETNQRYFKYLIDLSDQKDDVDVYQIDVIWPGLMAQYFHDLRDFIDKADIQQHLSTIIENNTVEGRLVGMPWFTDVGLLYYRKDLLEKYGFSAPEQWTELADMALHIQAEERLAGNEELWGLVFQGGAYEGLTCNALEWINSYAGGAFIDDQGNITVNNPRAVVAVARAAGWVGTLTPERVTSFNEEDARTSFQLGNAVFMRNWPYAWALVNGPDSPVAGKVDVAPLPKGGLRGHSASALGGWQLAVSRYSRHPDIAADLVRYLTSKEVQKHRAIEGSYAPTIMSLYEDPEVLEANPFFAKLRPILKDAVARPSSVVGKEYMAVTAYIWDAVNRILLGADTAVTGLARLEDQLRLSKARGEW